MLSSSNFQLSLFLMSTKSYLKFRTIRGTPQKWVGFGKPLFCAQTCQVAIHLHIVYEPHLNGSSALQHFKCSNIHNRILFTFYPGLHMHMYSGICHKPHLQLVCVSTCKQATNKRHIVLCSGSLVPRPPPFSFFDLCSV